MARATAPVVGLWAHRWDDLGQRTGVGRYSEELARALGELGGPVRYERRGGRHRGGPGPGPTLRQSWPPRRLLHASWLATGRPALERVAPPVDLLHVLFPSFPVPTRAALVATVNDLFVLDQPTWYRPGERRAVVTSLHRLADRADRVITLSQHVADQVVERLGVERARVTVVPLGVSPALLADGPTGSSPSGRPYVVAVGAATARKDLGTAIRAVAATEDLDLLLVGPPGPADDALRALAAELGVAGRVHLLGPRPDEQLAALVRGAVALLHPSLDEGFGLPPLEAMALGTPALVARSGALPEVVGDAAPVLLPGDVDAWAAAVARVRDDPEHRATLVAAGTRHAATRTWTATAARTASVHEELLRERGVL